MTFPISDTVLALWVVCEEQSCPFLDKDPVIQEVLYMMGDIPYTL